VATPGFEVDEERMLAARLAGALFLTAAAAIVVLLLVPGVEDDHWRWVVGLAAACVAWAVYCLKFARPEEHGPWFWHVPATLAIPLIAALMASTGGAHSPARAMIFFLLFYCCYFFPRRIAWLYVGGCITIALSPLAYDRSAVGEGYVGELIVLCAAYATLGWLIISGKAIMVDLRERARSLSLRDPLTDLPNRRAMIEWLGHHMKGDTSVGMIMADLDGFKDVNTLYGYPAGDATLCDTARALQDSVRDGDLVARLGGDEFAVLTVDANVEVMQKLSFRLLDAVRGMDRSAAEDVQLTASIGWALYPDDAQTVGDLVAAADFCVRGAKSTGKDRALAAVDWRPAA
jgi:diguanylate cyclase (GGDEF)-like protein